MKLKDGFYVQRGQQKCEVHILNKILKEIMTLQNSST